MMWLYDNHGTQCFHLRVDKSKRILRALHRWNYRLNRVEAECESPVQWTLSDEPPPEGGPHVVETTITYKEAVYLSMQLDNRHIPTPPLPELATVATRGSVKGLRAIDKFWKDNFHNIFFFGATPIHHLAVIDAFFDDEKVIKWLRRSERSPMAYSFPLDYPGVKLAHISGLWKDTYPPLPVHDTNK